MTQQRVNIVELLLVHETKTAKPALRTKTIHLPNHKKTMSSTFSDSIPNQIKLLTNPNNPMPNLKISNLEIKTLSGSIPIRPANCNASNPEPKSQRSEQRTPIRDKVEINQKKGELFHKIEKNGTCKIPRESNESLEKFQLRLN